MTYLEKCPCGSGMEAFLEVDARNIPLGYMCDSCKKEKLSHFRPDVLSNPNYWADEPIEPEEYY